MFSQFLQLQSSMPELEGMNETQLKEFITKLKTENSTLETEIGKFKTQVSSVLNSQNELKSRNLELEKELQQSRIQSKLKISKLQKEISSLSLNTPLNTQTNSTSTSNTVQTTNIVQNEMNVQTDNYDVLSVTASPDITDSTKANTGTDARSNKALDVKRVDAESQTVVGNETLKDDTKGDVDNTLKLKYQEDIKRETEEKISSLRNSHKENLNKLAVEIQELKAQLVILKIF